MPLIDAADVSVVLGGRAVLGKRLAGPCNAGETVALIGPNGAGKTTLLRVLLGLLPYRGRVEVLGKPPERLTRADRQQIGYVPQALQFDRSMPLLTRELLWAMLGERFHNRAAMQGGAGGGGRRAPAGQAHPHALRRASCSA
jgi:zinc transport system ATP-binding protein